MLFDHSQGVLEVGQAPAAASFGGAVTGFSCADFTII